MPLLEMMLVNRARLRSKRALVLDGLAVLGLAVGVALLFASQVASTNLGSYFRQLTREVVGPTQFQIDARGTEGFSDRLVGAVQRLPGVAATLPVLERQATLYGPTGQTPVDLLGADPRFAKAGGPLLQRFRATQLAHQHAIALPAPVAGAIGARTLGTLKLQVGARVSNVLLGTVLQPSDIGGLINSPVVIAPVAYAQMLTGMPGRLTRIFVRASAGQTSEVSGALKRFASEQQLNFEPANFDSTLFRVAAAPANQGESLFSAISAIVGFLLAFNAIVLTIPERRKMIEDARLNGSTRGAIIQALLFDAVLIGLLACVFGLLLGEVLSSALFKATPGYLSFAFPIGTQRLVTVRTVALSCGVGMVAACFGVLVPMRRILARPLTSPPETDTPERRFPAVGLVVGVLCLVATTIILLVRPQSAVLGCFTLVLALVVLLPFLLDLFLAAFEASQKPFYVAAARLAVAEMRDPKTRVRSLGVAATGAIAVFGAVAIQGAQQNLQTGLDRTAVEMNRVTAIWVSPSGTENTLGTTPFTPLVADRLSHLPSVQTVSIYRGGFLTIGDRRAWVIAPPRDSPMPVPAGQLLSGNASSANARLRSSGWAVLSEAIASELHVHVGQQFILPSPRPLRLRVAALSTNVGWPPGAIVMNAEDYATAWGSQSASALNITLAPGALVQTGRREVLHALGPNSGMAVQSASERARNWQTISRQGLSRLSQIATLILIAAILSMACVTGSLLWQRRDGLAYDKLQGYTSTVLWIAVFLESALMLGAGCTIGAVFGLYGQLVISHALATVTGFPVAINVGVLIALSSFAIVSLASLAIVAIPGYLAARIRPSTYRA